MRAALALVLPAALAWAVPHTATAARPATPAAPEEDADVEPEAEAPEAPERPASAPAVVETAPPPEPEPTPEALQSEADLLEAEATLQMGLTSNLQRARRRGEADGLVDISGEVFGALLHQRLSGTLDAALRQPLGLPELRNAQTHVSGTFEQPVGAMRLGAAVVGEYERSLTVFTETGTLKSALVRSALGARAAPYVAWAPEPFRVELSPVAGVRRVTGAEAYTLSDLGGRLDARWFDTPRIYGGGAVQWHARRFDGLHARTRDGQLPAVAPTVSLNLLDAELRLGSQPVEDLDLALRLSMSRVYDRFDGFHSHVDLGAALEAAWQPERGFGAHASGEVVRRTYGLRVVSPTQSGDETELTALAGMQYTLKPWPWLTPVADYEAHFAEAGGVGTVYTEHVGLLGLRGRY